MGRLLLYDIVTLTQLLKLCHFCLFCSPH